MPRKHVKNYSGATGRITHTELTKLGSAYMIQPKMDGAYAHVHLDRTGCITRISSRTGRDYCNDNVTGLLGQFVGWPGAVLVGELTAHTEAGNRDAQNFGARRVHLFDMAYGYGTRCMRELPYHARRAALLEMQAKIYAYTYNPWETDAHGKRDKRSGRFCNPVPAGITLTPVVPQVAPDSVSRIWDRVQTGELEGLVAVAQSAKIGARGAKRKCKLTSTCDAVVLDVRSRQVTCLYMANYFTVSRGKHDVCKGDVVEITHDGWYAGGKTPRFARIKRVRHDLVL